MKSAMLANFEALADAPNAIPKLRELILQLAVRGRLVQQDPDDEPAAELLKRVRAEKQRLVVDGLPQNRGPAHEVGPDETPWELPPLSAWARLVDVAVFQAGRTPATKNPSYWSHAGDGFAWASIADMPAGGVVHDTARRVTQKAVDEVFRVPPVAPGTLLMSFKLTLGKVCLAGTPTYHNEAIIAVKPYAGIDRDCLFRMLPLLVGLAAR